MTLYQEKPSQKSSKLDTSKALQGLGKNVKEGLQKGVDAASEGSKKLMNWFQEFFTKSKEKGLKASLMGVFVGVLALMNNVGSKVKDKVKAVKQTISKKSESAKAKATEARADLKAKVECSALPDIPAKIMDQVPDSIKGTPPAIAKAVEIALKEKITGDHCWDWTSKIYAMAGYHPNWKDVEYDSVQRYGYDYEKVEPGMGKYIQNSNGDYIKSKSGIYNRKPRKKVTDCGKHHAIAERSKGYLKNTLKPGDHVFINNKNPYDMSGNHSEIFLGWVNKNDPNNLKAIVAGYSGKGRPPYKKTRNYSTSPVTWIGKPKPKKAKAPLVA